MTRDNDERILRKRGMVNEESKVKEREEAREMDKIYRDREKKTEIDGERQRDRKRQREREREREKERNDES